MLGGNVSEVCIASVSKHTLSAIQILSQYGGSESLKGERCEHNKKTGVKKWMSLTRYHEQSLLGFGG